MQKLKIGDTVKMRVLVANIDNPNGKPEEEVKIAEREEHWSAKVTEILDGLIMVKCRGQEYCLEEGSYII